MPRTGGGTTRAPTRTAPVLAVRMRLAEPTVPMLVTRKGCERATSPAQPSHSPEPHGNGRPDTWVSATPHRARTSTATMMLHDETHEETIVWDFARMLGDR